MKEKILCGMICVLGLLIFFMPVRKYSENENRYLAKLPEVTLDRVVNGSFEKEWEAYLCDHFPFRDAFVCLHTLSELAAGKRMVNGVYFADDGYLIDEYVPPDTDRIGECWKKFAKKLGGRKTALMLVPSAADMLAELVPDGAAGSQKKDMEKLWEVSGLWPVDCREELLREKKEKQIYYRTDHHWTAYGAYAGYAAFCKAVELEPGTEEFFDIKTMAEGFRGTTYSRSGAFFAGGESLAAPAERKLSVYYEDTGETADSLYSLSYLEKKDKYSVFLDNVHSLVTVENADADTGRVLALIKDSYANSMVPFLAQTFKKIYVFDPRTYKKSAAEFIEEHAEITDVLLLYNMDTLWKDAGALGLY